MLRMKPMSFTGVALFALLFLTASASQNAKAGDLKKIAVMPKTLVNDVFQIRYVEAAEREAKKEGVATERFASRNYLAVEDQINVIESLISRGEFGALILDPIDAKSMGNILEKATKAGLVVILVDSTVEKGDYVTAITTDNKGAAGEGADFVAKLVSEKGNVALLEGEPGGSTAADRKNGFKETIAKYPNIHLVASLNGHWTLPGGVEATEALIAEHKDLDAIFTCSDMMGIGARQVLERAAQKAKEGGDSAQADRFKNVKIVGFDGVTEGFKAVKDGRFSGTVAQMPETMGTRAVEIAVQLMKGEKQPGDFPKYIDSGAMVITSDNVDQVAAKLGLKL
jgi:ribose transport system substrate-binding protein